MESIVLQTGVSPPLNDSYLLQKQLELLLETNSKKINNELGSIKTMINGLNEEIIALKRAINDSKLHQRVEQPQPAVQIVETRVEREEPRKGFVSAAANGVKDESVPKPRYGDYKPEDVSINKFFYFGGGKR